MGKPRSRRTTERIAIGWSPFVLGAATATFGAQATALMFANLVLGLGCALLLASSNRSTGRLLRLLPRLGAAILAVNALLLATLYAIDRI